MGQDGSYELRQQNLMTKIMLKNQSQIIDHIEQQKMEVNQPINQMGDTIMHYAAYKSLKQLMQYLLNHHADPYQRNYRCLSSIDVAVPEIRQWLIIRFDSIKSGIHRENSSAKGEKMQLQSIIINDMRVNKQ